MKKILTIFAYIISFILMSLYIILELNDNVTITPLFRIVTVILICLFMYTGSKVSDNQKLMKVNLWCWFIFYIILLATLTLFDDYYNRNHFNILNWNKEFLNSYLKYSFNIIPFKTIINFTNRFLNNSLNTSVFLLNIGGNLLAFTPFAFFLPRLFKKQKRLLNFVLTMFSIVCLIEILQFITLSGACDIDDVILNVSGSIIAYKLLSIKLIDRFFNKIF